MTELTPQQLAQLVGQGECFVHSHPKEALNFNDRLALMKAEPVSVIGGAEYTLIARDELILADTTAGSIKITLPPPANGREFQVVKLAAANMLTILPTAPSVVLGSPFGVRVYNQYTSLHFKAISSTEYILI